MEPHSHQQPRERQLQQRRVGVARAAAPGQHRAGERTLETRRCKRRRAKTQKKKTKNKTLLSRQFDKVQESFLSLEQQISAFQAHLEGLGKASRDGPAGKGAHAKASWSVDSTRSGAPLERRSSTSSSSSASASASEADAAPRSPRHLSSTIAQLQKLGRKK